MVWKVIGIGLCVILAGGIGYEWMQLRTERLLLVESRKIGGNPIEQRSGDSNVLSALEGIERRLSRLEDKDAAPRAPSAEPSAVPSAVVPQELDHNGDSPDSTPNQDEVVKERLSTETRDSSWAAVTETKLRDAAKEAAGEGGSYSLTGLSCLTSICRADLVLPDLIGPQGTMPRFPALVDGMTGYSYRPPVKQADGTFVISYTFFRRGFPMP